jgi:hypothetical protein
MSEIQTYLDSLNPTDSLKLVQDLLSVTLRKDGFDNFKIPKTGTYKICISGIRLQIVISCSFKSKTYVKENNTDQ